MRIIRIIKYIALSLFLILALIFFWKWYNVYDQFYSCNIELNLNKEVYLIGDTLTATLKITPKDEEAFFHISEDYGNLVMSISPLALNKMAADSAIGAKEIVFQKVFRSNPYIKKFSGIITYDALRGKIKVGFADLDIFYESEIIENYNELDINVYFHCMPIFPSFLDSGDAYSNSVQCKISKRSRN